MKVLSLPLVCIYENFMQSTLERAKNWWKSAHQTSYSRQSNPQTEKSHQTIFFFFAVENGKYGNFMLIVYAHRYSMYKYKWICFIIAFDGGIWISNVFMRFSTRHSRPINRAWFLQRIHLQIPRSCQNTNAILCVRKDISFMEILTHNLSLCYAYIWTTYHFKKDMLHYFYRKKRAKNALTQCKKNFSDSRFLSYWELF